MADECYYSGDTYADGSTICSDGISFACFNASWNAQGSFCADTDTPVDPNVESPDEDSTSENIGGLAPSGNLSQYNGRTYSEGALIYLNGTRYRASFGRWLASGSVPTSEGSLESDEYAANVSENATENFDLCLGDGSGALVTSSRDPKARLKVCGRDGDLIRYWYDGTSIVYDPIRDGDGLGTDDIKFPLAPATPNLPRPPVAVRHGRDRDLVRIYTPPKPGKSAMATIYEPRTPNFLSFGWLAIDKLEVAGVKFVYDAGRNAFVFEGGGTFGLSIIPIGG